MKLFLDRNYILTVIVVSFCFLFQYPKAENLKDASANIADMKPSYRLLSAAGNGTLDKVTLQGLISEIPPDKQQETKNKALIYACRFGKTKTMRLLIEAGADYNYANGNGYTVLMYAVASGSEKAVKFLTSLKNININQRAYNGSDALMRACGWGRLNSGFKPNPAIVKILLNAKADPTAINEDGENALFYAIHFEGYEGPIVKMLSGDEANPPQAEVVITKAKKPIIK